MTELVLPLATYESEDVTPSIKAMRQPIDNYSTWKPELEAAVAAAIRRYPNMDAEWWLAPSAVLEVIEQHLLDNGAVSQPENPRATQTGG
jgi:hypothetical protein